MNNKITRRIIVQIVIIAFIIVVGSLIKTYIAKDFSKEEFKSVSITFSKIAKEKEQSPVIKEEKLNEYSKDKIYKDIKDIFGKEKFSVEELNWFGNEYRVKSKEITNEQKDKIKSTLEEKYNNENIKVSIGEIKEFPAKENIQNIKPYVIYLSIIIIISFLGIVIINFSEKRGDK